MRLRDLSQELVELGPRGTLFRASWEVRTRMRAAAGRPPRSWVQDEETRESAARAVDDSAPACRPGFGRQRVARLRSVRMRAAGCRPPPRRRLRDGFCASTTGTPTTAAPSIGTSIRPRANAGRAAWSPRERCGPVAESATSS